MPKFVPDPSTTVAAPAAEPTTPTGAGRPLEKAADLADRHGQVTRHAVLLQYDADTADPTADDYDARMIEAARAQIAAGRFEDARRARGAARLAAAGGAVDPPQAGPPPRRGRPVRTSLMPS